MRGGQEPRDESTRTATPTQSQPRCPVCNGPLFPLRDSYRCARCSYSLCVGCETQQGPDAGGLGE